MRVYTTRKTIVDLKHFRYCSKHYRMLLTLQQEAPNMMLELKQPFSGQSATGAIPIHQLDLEDQLALIGLNPNDAHAV
jgi:hypothetical protein